MATSALELFLIALVYIVQTETNAQVIPLPVELHTTVYLPCSCPICPESTSGVQWYRSSNQNTFIQDGEALAWWSEGITGGSQGFGIKDDFSMTIVSVNLIDQHEQELYRCIVTPYGGAAECEHDVKLELYAKPESSPVIKYIRHNNGFNVTCSISNVFPMTFPIFTTKEGKRTASNNSDGTYNTAVTHLFPANEKDTTIECLYSALNFKSIASLGLFIVDDDILGQPEDENTTEKNKTRDVTLCQNKDKNKLQYFEHIYRIEGDNLEKIITRGHVEGQRRRCKPKVRWADGIKEITGMNICTAHRYTQDRRGWNVIIDMVTSVIHDS
ncbi:uncharacterized protein LOC105441778 [Strongylocentrotus purpuratus]|uniref:Ig-like domain-containing protein n=1 Tax=Strongylocentrotus purpuratus TaxID=7668 RepID=A0A7M7SVG7_STRPU|nr:uncharacterized protein LOC105441778 [Strongylocentrotus purpuratus]